jgi:hypothetical protein
LRVEVLSKEVPDAAIKQADGGPECSVEGDAGAAKKIRQAIKISANRQKARMITALDKGARFAIRPLDAATRINKDLALKAKKKDNNDK